MGCYEVMYGSLNNCVLAEVVLELSCLGHQTDSNKGANMALEGYLKPSEDLMKLLTT